MTTLAAKPDASPRSVRWWLDHFEEAVASVALVIVVVATSWGVITRYITAQAAAWTIEVSTIGFAWVVFFGSVACFKYKMHPAVDVPYERLPRRLGSLIAWFNHVLMLGFFVFCVWFGVRFAIDAWITRSSVLGIPMTIVYGPAALCFALMLLRYLQYVIPGKTAGSGDA